MRCLKAYSVSFIFLIVSPWLPASVSQDSSPCGHAHDGEVHRCNAWHRVNKEADCTRGYCTWAREELNTIPTVTTTPENVPTDSPDDCKLWYYANGEDTCDAIAAIFGTFTTQDFIAWNPSVLEDCSAIENYVWYCIARSDALITKIYGLPGGTSLPPPMSTQPGVSQQSSNSSKTIRVSLTAAPGNNSRSNTNSNNTTSDEASSTRSANGGSHGE
ncbi:hypothetical protein FDECE_9619 [Fusarium decemcellulare]|nr:hypothetical protein FDECE_9619 [Fusarium decemcellulare]